MTEMQWTSEQRNAITSAEHTLLAASAGTGKTTTVIGKILWHLGFDIGGVPECPPQHRVRLHEIAAVTFTEKAAYDLKRKLRDAIRENAPNLLWDIDRATIGTIHSFCGDLLRGNALRLGVDPGFRILDDRESQLEMYELIKEIVIERLKDGDQRVKTLAQGRDILGTSPFGKSVIDYVRDIVRDVRWHGERYDTWVRAGMIDVTYIRSLCEQWDEKDVAPLTAAETLVDLAHEVIGRWRVFEREENVRDFDSLILDARNLLTSGEGAPALAAVRRRYRLFIIDEFQDTDAAQRDLAFAIAGLPVAGCDESASVAAPGTTGPLLFLVGDAKQSIYGFRGADISVWNEALQALGPDLPLTNNFRSDQCVVEFVNRMSKPVMNMTGLALEQKGLTSRIAYKDLQPARMPSDIAEVEWLEVNGGRAAERREREAEMVAARIRDVVIDLQRGDTEGIRVEDPRTGEVRDCSYRDIAILFRSRTGLEHYQTALQRYGVPYYVAGDAGLKNRLEILDLITLLRLIDNPRDDLSAFAFLRSPFVGLRDEVIARIRLTQPGGSLLQQAGNLTEDVWFEAPEHAQITHIERRALDQALSVLDDLSGLRTRVPVDELVEDAIDRTGYLHHFFFLDQYEPKLADIRRFVRVLQGYRHHTVGSFLEIWDRWDGMDLGIPQAPLYSDEDDVVTLSTIHSAKGLEWPVVFLVDFEGTMRDRFSNAVWSDRALGPIFCPSKDDRGPRAMTMCDRRRAEDQAEEARLLYVAATRARDRLVIAGPTRNPKGLAEWLNRGMSDTVRVTSAVPDVEIPPLPPEPSLAWLDAIAESEDIDRPLVRPVTSHPIRATRSATELMNRRKRRDEWRLKYVHGVVPSWYFTHSFTGSGLLATIRGIIVHGVLERIRDEDELAELLDVTIGALDAPELEERLTAGSEYRRALEKEIREVVRSSEWKWYVEGEHYRELRFVDLRTPTKWRVGALDLYKPEPGDPGWIVDFKTHDIAGSECLAKAREYSIQAAVYRSALRRLAADARVRFHFTRPNTVVNLD